MKRVAAALVVLSLAPAGCGGEEVGRVRIPLTSPTSLDPTLIDQVVVVAVKGSSTSCVAAAGSNTCYELQSTTTARAASGFLDVVTLSAGGGSVATFSGLPREKTCFVAEALAPGGKPLALGCAEVALTQETNKIEILLAPAP